jgi:2-phospho-L-lactate/phosphoenolpyruvate guanylyltransferase
VAAQLYPCILLPAKSIADGKSRLRGFLDCRSHKALTLVLLRHSLTVAARFAEPANCAVVSHCEEVLEIAQRRGMRVIRHCGNGGLNAAVGYALEHLRREGERDMLLMATDMPRLRVEDLRKISDLGTVNGCPVIGADRHGSGTNLLFLPAGLRMQVSYGYGSLQRHMAAANRAAGRTLVYKSEESAFDIDTPEDLRLWRGSTAIAGVNDRVTYTN